MKRPIFASLLVLTFAMLACSFGASGGEESVSMDQLQADFDKLPAGDASRGEQLFVSQNCKTCHVDLEVGPAFQADPPLATRAESRKPGYPTELYLYESIVAPNAYVVSGFQKDIMPAEPGRTLTEQELADLIAYLMTLR